MNNGETLTLHEEKHGAGPAQFEEAMQLCQCSALRLLATPAFEDPTGTGTTHPTVLSQHG